MSDVNEQDLEQERAIKATKENATRARKALKNPDIKWLLDKVKEKEKSLDRKLHYLLLEKGGDHLEAKLIAWKIDFLKNFRTTPKGWLEAEKRMKVALRKQKRKKIEE